MNDYLYLYMKNIYIYIIIIIVIIISMMIIFKIMYFGDDEEMIGKNI